MVAVHFKMANRKYCAKTRDLHTYIRIIKNRLKQTDMDFTEMVPRVISNVFILRDDVIVWRVTTVGDQLHILTRFII